MPAPSSRGCVAPTPILIVCGRLAADLAALEAGKTGATKIKSVI